jgi:hypothetical protein
MLLHELLLCPLHAKLLHDTTSCMTRWLPCTHHFFARFDGCLQRPNATWDVRQELSVLYSRFYASLMGCKCRPDKQVCSIPSSSHNASNIAAIPSNGDMYQPPLCNLALHDTSPVSASSSLLLMDNS